MSAIGVYTFHRAIWLGVCGISPAWAICVAYSGVGWPRPKCRISKCSGLRFFMDLSGNKGLLNRELVAFFASRNSLPEARNLARKWAYEISKTDKIVISGFHSPIEREVLEILLMKGVSVVVALGRSLYKRIPQYLEDAYQQGRVLFISFRDYSRPSLNNSQLRNWAAADLAVEVVLAPFPDQSQLSSLYFSFSRGKRVIKILK